MRREIKQDMGWTLAELLVVVAIIATLAAIVWAVMQPARDRAIQAECTTKLRQMWMALEMYRQEYDGIDPPTATRLSQTALPIHVDHEIYFRAAYTTKYGSSARFCRTNYRRWGTEDDVCRRYRLDPQGHVISIRDDNACAPYMVGYNLIWSETSDSDGGGIERDNRLFTALGSNFEILYDDYHNPPRPSYLSGSDVLTIMAHFDGHLTTRRIPSWPDYRMQQFISLEP